MKKVQNYLTKPEELKKKLDDPSFKHDFLQWSKSHICSAQNRHSRSKSPHQNSKKQLTGISVNKSHSRSKENIAPNAVTRNHSLSKKNITFSKAQLDQGKPRDDSTQRKKLPSKSQNHYHSLSFLGHNRSLEQSNQQQHKTNYNSLKKDREDSLIKSKSLKKKKTTGSFLTKRQSQPDKKLQFHYSYRTKQGVLASNPAKTNQDRLLVKNKIGSDPERNLFVVADGHGSFGHCVSEMIVSNFGRLAEKQFAQRSVQEALPAIYDEIQKIVTASDVNVGCSGSTLVSVVIENSHITCANVGDSRAILARQVDRKSWELIYLSQDQKPSVESEKRRILKNGGRVHCLKDQRGEPVGPMRVWLPNQNIQGLAMSRSIGDNVSKPYGVTHKPEIIKIGVDKRDKFILLASDGVWEFLSNQEVLQLIVPFYREKKLEEACDALLKLAYSKWTVDDATVVDDITFILIFIDN